MKFPGIDYGSDYEDSVYNIPEVLHALNLDLNKNGDWANGLCPFHEDTSPSFGLNLKSGLWNCFACGAGHIEQLVAHVLEFSTDEEVYNWLKPFNRYNVDDIDVIAHKLESLDFSRDKVLSEFDDFNFRFSLWVRNIGRTKHGNKFIENILAIYDKFVNMENYKKAEQLAAFVMNNNQVGATWIGLRDN